MINLLNESMNHSGHKISALTNDLYEVTMACAYWKAGVSREEAAFHLFFRENPFGGGFTLACGLADAIDFIREFHFEEDDLAYLASQIGNDGKPLFEEGFLDHLRSLRLACDIDAVPEGTLVFPHEPMIRVCGPIIQCQLLETALLNILNFQSLIATKAARVCQAAEDGAVIEFGLRRAQGTDGGLSATRAAYVGGCAGTSNLLAGKRFGIPVSGTQAHSWVMFFETEEEAFQKYAEAMPNNSVFLVDTYDSLDGVRHAIEASQWLREHGHEPIGIRLDSGDRVKLSIESRKMLDAAGFPDAAIVCSGDLDEFSIADLKRRGAKIDVWGVGTRLATGQPDAALGGVYKLGAVRVPGQPWRYRIKISDESEKSSCPGLMQVRRFFGEDGKFLGDAIYETGSRSDSVGQPGCSGGATNKSLAVVDLVTEEHREFSAALQATELLLPIFRRGELVYRPPSIGESRARAREQLGLAPPEILRLKDPQAYPVGLESSLHRLKSSMIEQARQRHDRAP